MSERPNECYIYNRKKDLQKLKRNQMNRRFPEFFDIMLNPDYYEGTIYGKYFYETNSDGTSRIYVKDPLEKELESLRTSNDNMIKYLVGYTGIGKTTLLRNFWKVLDRDIHIDNHELIIYISFYYANLYSNNPQKSIEDEIVRYMLRACRKLMENWTERLPNSEEFWEKFYNYIEKHKPVLLENDEFTPATNFYKKDKELKDKKHQLDKLCNEKKLEYYSCMLKYLLCFVDEIQNIVFIYDDIESKEVLYHHPLVEIARHIHSCFSVIEDKTSQVKTIVALRAYTFRSNIDRQLEARRECIEKNTIRKKDVAKFHDIFLKRFNEIERIEKKKGKVKELKSYENAKEQFLIVENEIDKSFGSLIYQLVNCNICNAMQVYASIMANVRWIAVNEHENAGKFIVSSDSYRLTAETVFRAIACGNEKAYFGDNNTFFPNILNNYRKDTELLGLYIIKFLIQNQATDLYGEKYVEGEKILQNIKGLFLERNNLENLNSLWIEKISCALEYLYDKSILFRSIYDIESISESQIERKFHSSYKLYLSPRGKCLYGLFQRNALLLELYRDDLFTDLENNDKLTYEMSTYEVIKYLLDYIYELFQKEQQYIRCATHCLSNYQESFGNEFIVSMLLEGVVKNIHSYYPKRDAEYRELILRAQEIIQYMDEYSNMIDEKYHFRFTISQYLKEIMNYVNNSEIDLK